MLPLAAEYRLAVSATWDHFPPRPPSTALFWLPGHDPLVDAVLDPDIVVYGLDIHGVSPARVEVVRHNVRPGPELG